MKQALAAILCVLIPIFPASSFAGNCGDVNNSGAVNLLDVTYLINYLYKGGPEPDCGPSYPGICGDPDNSSAVNLLDVTYLINYLYKGGPEPDCGPEYGTVTDIDGNVYQTVKIGSQWWMAENLKVLHYRNGDPIPAITLTSEWYTTTSGAYCPYNNSGANIAVYGTLYNWYAIGDIRSIAPEGWHVASDDEYQTLIDYLGGEEVAGGKMKETGTSHWLIPNLGATNESGFNALPGGLREDNGDYFGLRSEAYFWSSTEIESMAANGLYLRYISEAVFDGDHYKRRGYSVRCVKD